MSQNKTNNVRNRCRRSSYSYSVRSERSYHSWSFIPFRSTFAVAFLMVSSLMLDGRASVASSSSSAATTRTTSTATATSTATTSSDAAETNPDSIKIIFSDLDGTLIHYPKKTDCEPKQSLLEFPPSSTGMRGVISAKTLSLVDEIRNKNHVKFVLISGMRTSTLLQRLPYLPKADAYCSENGGRIFYPIEAAAGDNNKEKDETKRIINSIDRGSEDDDSNVFWVQPARYKHEGSGNGSGRNGGDPHRNKPFGIREDKAWRNQMTRAIGGDSFGSFSLNEIYEARDDPNSISMPLNERDGFLWDFARDLIHNHGFVLDTKGYSTCFRVNQKQQKQQQKLTSDGVAVVVDTSPGRISALLGAPKWEENRDSIDSSVNLSCVDFYPSCSGKKNCCLYLASKFFPKECQPIVQETNDEDDAPTDAATTILAEDLGTITNSNANANASSAEEDFLSNHAVCMCDDDNDLEMALACQHAYLPDVASQSMIDTIEQFPDHFTKTFRENEEESSPSSSPSSESGSGEGVVVLGTDASDVALSMIWSRTNEARTNDESDPQKQQFTVRIHRFFRKNVLSVVLLVGAAFLMK